MRYFILEDDMSERQRNRWHIGRVRLADDTIAFLNLGTPLDAPQPLHAEVTHIGHVLDFCHTSFGVPIATKVLADSIGFVAGTDLQCLPVTIGGQTGMMALNALRLIRCIDERRSVYVKWTELDHRPDKAGDYRYFEKLVLARQAVPHDAHFFRIKGYLIHIIVSETVKNAMERVGCYGAKFTELEMA